MKFFTNTLDPMIALPLKAVLKISLFLLVCCMDRPKGFYYGNESEIKKPEHIKINV